jgi:cytochrome c-type biogenesis protein CcmF
MFGDPESTEGVQVNLARGQSAVIGDGAYSVLFVEYDMDMNHEGMESSEVAVGARVDVTNTATGETRRVRPVYQIREDRTVSSEPVSVEDWGLGVSFGGMNVDSGTISLVVNGVDAPPEDWLVVQAYEKPLISFVWFGFILLSFGFCVSIYRRAQEQQFENRRSRKG